MTRHVPAAAPAKRRSDLATRAFAGVVMIAVALGALSLGGAAFWLLVSLAGLLMLAEWGGLMRAPRWKLMLALVMLGLVLGLTRQVMAGAYPWFVHSGEFYARMGLAAGIAGIAVALLTFSARLGAGLLYVGWPVIGLLYLRALPDGMGLALWTLAVVWATDIGAYFAGRAIGGPKLAPRLSPNKTWAGLLGGTVAALLIGAAIALLLGLPVLLIGLGGVMAVLAQAGDLFESWLKRRAGVKDSGRILPGHGGVLDRLDGLVPVATVVAAIAAAGWL